MEDPKQQQWQFSMRRLLLAITLISLFLGGAVYVFNNGTRWYLDVLRQAQENQKRETEDAARRTQISGSAQSTTPKN